MKAKIELAFLTFICLCTLFAVPKAYSEICLESTLTADMGYRWDKISNRASLSGPTIPAAAATQTAKRMQTCLLGGLLQWSYCNVVIKGSYHFGKIEWGHYYDGDFSGETRGYTVDAGGSAGYLFNLGECWGVVPLGGWSYDKLHVHVHETVFAGAGSVTSVGKIKYYSRFQGPWGGFDVHLQPMACLRFNMGYELHYAHWHGTRFLEKGDLGSSYGLVTGFSSQRRDHHVWGNVFHLEGAYKICERFEAGLGLKYQVWKSGTHGSYRQTATAPDPSVTSLIITDVEWESFAATLQIGYIF